MQLLRRRYASLTPREREVMALVCSGLLNKQVGGELGISGDHGEGAPGTDDAQDEGQTRFPDLVTMAARLGEPREAPDRIHRNGIDTLIVVRVEARSRSRTSRSADSRAPAS